MKRSRKAISSCGIKGLKKDYLTIWLMRISKFQVILHELIHTNTLTPDNMRIIQSYWVKRLIKIEYNSACIRMQQLDCQRGSKWKILWYQIEQSCKEKSLKYIVLNISQQNLHSVRKLDQNKPKRATVACLVLQ